MRFQSICFLTITLLAIPHIAGANGMHYTTMGARKGELNPKSLHMKSLNFEKEEKEKLELQAKEKKEKEAMEAVWAKYKALAEGRYEQQKARPAAPIKPKMIEVPKPQATDTSKGFGILDQYEQIKARRSQMKMITMNRASPEKNEEQSGKKEKPENE